MIARRPILNIISRLLSTVSKTMEKHGVVPDVIDTAPAAKLVVRIHIRHCFVSESVHNVTTGNYMYHPL
jgi:hypothetical protein